ncbi:uncharacterized protein LOC141678258 isoform X2 [Apium graveolens]|uniref:uncharacterized protein LOC141678258 isoform X2 n=1 Tax=Apium graveolens TaxID=4045 RepID=UPI003D7AE42A
MAHRLGCGAEISRVGDGGANRRQHNCDVSAWKRGHPPLPVTEVFLECRGLSRQSVDASRLKTKVELKGLASWLHWLEHVFNLSVHLRITTLESRRSKENGFA